MDDHDLDGRLRAGLDDLAAAAGDPPPWPVEAVGLRSVDAARPLWPRLLVAVGVVALVVGGLAAVARRGGGGVAEGPEGSAQFFNTRWYLTSAELNGVAVDITPGVIPWVFGEDNPCTFSGPGCVGGPMLLGRDGCNQFEVGIVVDGDRVTWGQRGMSTLAACSGELQTAFDQITGGDGFTYGIIGDSLTVVGSGVELGFTAGDPLGTPQGFVLDEGRAGDIAYRVTWNAGVSIEWVDVSTATMTNGQGYAATTNNLSANFVDFGGPRYLLALLPDAAVAASYVTDGGETHSLAMLDAEGAPVIAASRLFEGDPGPGAVVALGGSGEQLASIALSGADQPGITSLPPVATTAPVVTTAPIVTSSPAVTTLPVPTTATTCGLAPGSPTDLSVEPPEWFTYGEYHRWTDLDGCPVRVDVIAQTAGPDHCEWQSVTFLTVGDPVGVPFDNPTVSDARRFVWDPEGALPPVDDVSRSDVVARVDLPSTAFDSGYRDGTAELWLDSADPSSLYRVNGDSADRFVEDADDGFVCD